MALLTRMTSETVEEDVANVLDSFIAVVGEVPKPILMLAGSPGLFMHQASLIGYYRDHDNLDHGLMACIRYLAAHKLGYKACIEFNGTLLKKRGLTDADLKAMGEDPAKAPLEAREVALLKFVIKGLEDADAAGSDSIKALQGYGWNESDIIDAVNLGFGMMVHGRMMSYFQMDK